MTTEKLPHHSLEPGPHQELRHGHSRERCVQDAGLGVADRHHLRRHQRAADAIDLNANPDQQGAIVVAILVVGIGLACWSAFFGYVISLLRDVAQNTEDNLK